MDRDAILRKYPPQSENLLALLHDLQDARELHYLTEEDLRAAADHFHLPLSFVHGVATFYTMYSLKPRGRHVIRFCQSPACHLMGGVSVGKTLQKLLGVDFGETTPDHEFTLEMSSCLGVCGVAPAMMVDDRVYGNLDEEKVASILESIRREK